MPIYDYRCSSCRKRFAVFFRSFSDVSSAVACQHCGSAEVARLAPRVALVTGEDARLDRLSDPSALGDVDENDPASVARWAKKLGREMGEDLGDEFDDAMDELAAGGTPDDGTGGEPDPMPYEGGSSDE
ncbi:MAG: zinc ribbon domain-containing protein [Chloroflexota bacterium]|nr:zinc ribbon domain-containing protein [Chloroflexota bacterium]MDE3194668.1 zinc ribbon domain-containing protein [Chloroflexota bacterium]